MSFNVTVSGKEYSDIDSVKLPITDTESYATFVTPGVMNSILARTASGVLELPGLTEIGQNALTQCTKITSLNIPDVTVIWSMAVTNCSALASVYAPKLTRTNTWGFQNCTSLTSVSFPVLGIVGMYLFEGCTKLTTADMGTAGSITSRCFNKTALETLILRKDSVITLDNVDAFGSTPIASGTGYIYVPSALVDSYKAANNWSTYAAQFRAIEDYPDICG